MPSPVYRNGDTLVLKDIKCLGKGGQGEAWLCKNQKDGKLCVAKLTKGRGSFDKDKKGLAEEVRVLNKLRKIGRHPNVVHMFCFEQPDHHTLSTVYEYCDGGSLRQYLPQSNNGKLISNGFLWHIFLQITSGLAYIHHGVNLHSPTPLSHGPNPHHTPIIHRDISPDNLFLRTPSPGQHYPTIVIGDFGFATDVPTTYDYMKPHYQGPEFPMITHKGDVWATGCVVHKLGTGKDVMLERPKGWGEKEWWKSGLSRRPGDLGGKYDGDLNRGMWKCLEKERKVRVGSFELLMWLRRHRP